MTDGLLPHAGQPATGRPTPDPRTAYPRFRAISTRWMDNDIYGHVNNVVYYSYFDTAVNQYLLEQGVLDIERGPVIGLVVETHCNYFSAIAFPDVVHAGLRVARLGSSSVRYEPNALRFSMSMYEATDAVLSPFTSIVETTMICESAKARRWRSWSGAVIARV